ncbi:hypothetical protein CF336_g5626 [Tilletia laevis]|nr:hypothetical protein CF336_g5626 [Tilletia laevis]
MIQWYLPSALHLPCRTWTSKSTRRNGSFAPFRTVSGPSGQFWQQFCPTFGGISDRRCASDSSRIETA